MKIDNFEQKAIKKLEELGLDAEHLEQLREKFTLLETNLSYLPGGKVTEPDERFEEALKAFKELNIGEAYYLIDSWLGMDLYNILFIPYKGGTDDNTKKGIVLAYVYNPADPESSETGNIEVVVDGDMLVRKG